MGEILVIPGGGITGLQFFDAAVDLVDAGHVFDVLCGSSAGSVICTVVSLIDTKRIDDFKYFDNIVKKLKALFSPMGNYYLDMHDVLYGSGNSIKRFEENIKILLGALTDVNVLDMTMKEFNEHIYPKHIVISAFDLNENKLIYMHDDTDITLLSAILASCSFFGFGQYRIPGTDRMLIDANNIQDIPLYVIYNDGIIDTLGDVPVYGEDKKSVVIIDDERYIDKEKSAEDKSVMYFVRTWRYWIYKKQFREFVSRISDHEKIYNNVQVYSIKDQKIYTSLSEYSF